MLSDLSFNVFPVAYFRHDTATLLHIVNYTTLHSRAVYDARRRLRLAQRRISELQPPFVILNAVKDQVGRDSVALEHLGGLAFFVLQLQQCTTATCPRCVRNDKRLPGAVGKGLLYVLRDEILHCVQNDKASSWLLELAHGPYLNALMSWIAERLAAETTGEAAALM